MTETQEKMVIATIFLIATIWFIWTAFTVISNYTYSRCMQTATNKEQCQ